MFFVVYNPTDPNGEIKASGNVQAELAYLVYVQPGCVLMETDEYYPATAFRVELEPEPHVVPIQ